jgi:hypothetical protein
LIEFYEDNHWKEEEEREENQFPSKEERKIKTDPQDCEINFDIFHRSFVPDEVFDSAEIDTGSEK